MLTVITNSLISSYSCSFLNKSSKHLGTRPLLSFFPSEKLVELTEYFSSSPNIEYVFPAPV